jgi:hypothetical protein
MSLGKEVLLCDNSLSARELRAGRGATAKHYHHEVHREPLLCHGFVRVRCDLVIAAAAAGQRHQSR